MTSKETFYKFGPQPAKFEWHSEKLARLFEYMF